MQLGRLWARLARRTVALAQRGDAALRVWVSRETNPFLERALRIEARKQKPMVTVLGVALCTALVVSGGWYAWEMWADMLASAGPYYRIARLTLSLQRAVGDNPIFLAALLAAAVCGYSVVRVVRARSAYLLRQEVLKGTLDQLQLLPIPEERWLWLMSAHLTALALLVGAVGLPVYMLALYTAQWSVSDLIGLALVFLMLGHALPAWQPQLWKQAAGRGAQKRQDMKQWRENLKQARGDLDVPAGSGPMTTAQQLEVQRRTQRAMTGWDAFTPVSLEAEAVTTAEQPVPKAARKRQSSFGASSGGSFGSIFGWFGMWMGFNLIMTGLRFGGGAWGGALRSLWSGLPRDITHLAPAIPITWPLLLARLLTRPLPFFAFALPPLLLVLPFWIVALQQRYAALGAMVSTLETYWTPRRARRRATLRKVGSALGLFIFWGYGWHALITDGNLGGLLPGALLTTDWALAAGWTLTIVVAAFAAGTRVENRLTRAYADTVSLGTAAAAAGRVLVRVLAGALSLYFGCCWLGGQTGVSPAWQARLAPTTATLAAFLIADFGIFTLTAALSGNGRQAVRTAYWVWWLGLAAEAACLIAYGAIRGVPFHFEQAPHVVLSPIVTVLALFRFQLSRPTAQWWWGPLAQAVIGTACAGAAGYMQLSRAVSTGSLPTLAAPQRGHWSDVLVTPLLAAARFAQNVLVRFVRVIERADQALRSVNEVLVRAAARTENPVLHAEMRRRTQREHWTLQLLLLGLCELTLFIFIADPGALFGLSWQGAAASPVNVGEWGQHVVLGVLIPALLVIALTTFSIGQTFDRERANGTLLFLYLTPMTDAAILMGKLWPGLTYGALLLTTALPWLFIGCLAGLLGGAPQAALVTVFGLAYLLSSWVYIAYASIFFAIRSTKPTQGGAEAFLWVVGLEAIAAGLLAYVQTMRWNGLPPFNMAAFAITGAVVLTLMHGVLAIIAWQLALRVLRRQRYGDVLEKQPALWRTALEWMTTLRRSPAPRTSAQ